MRDRTLNIVRIQTSIKAYAFGKLYDPIIGRYVKNTASRWCSHNISGVGGLVGGD